MQNAKQILETWHINAQAWTEAIDQQTIESRKLVTNQAIVDAIRMHQPKRILDVGCGEGWLCRTLSTSGIECTGVDAILPLIERAKEMGSEDYFVFSYADLMDQQFTPSHAFDVVTINFALFEEDASLRNLFIALQSLLTSSGFLIIQTLHPMSACGNLPYADGWRDGSWAGFSEKFTQPAPWYFRTIASWQNVLASAKYTIFEIREPIHPISQLPASIIFTCKKQD